MDMIHRPHRDALAQAVDIFRDAMRPFILRNLRRAPGSALEATIRRCLPPHQADAFDHSLRQGKDMASAVDVNFFPNLVRKNWREVFSQNFRDDRIIQNELWLIADARNQVSHPGTQDLDGEFTRARLYDIADALGRINAPDQKRAVEDIRANLFGLAPASSGPAGTHGDAGNGRMDRERQSVGTANLRPGREAIRPDQDAIQGRGRQGELVDLQRAPAARVDTAQNGNPVSCCSNTYIAFGIRRRLANALKRLTG